MPEPLSKFEVFDLPFAAGTKDQIREEILNLARIAGTKASSVTFTNAHVIVEAHWSSELRQKLKQASLIVPDGVPVAWVLNAIQKPNLNAQRYSGPDLMVDILKATPNERHFFIGSTKENLEVLKTELVKKYGLTSTEFYSPSFSDSFTEQEKQHHLDLITAHKADFIWVGLGAPKQERYVIEMSQKTNSRGVWLAVGAAFDFLSGAKKRAPVAIQKLGMEWAFRLAVEPKRLAARYLKTNPVFIGLAFKELIHSRK